MPTYKNQEKTDKSWLKDNSQRLLAYNQLPRAGREHERLYFEQIAQIKHYPMLE
ncbi:hypothetical protein [Photorhabdus sp. RM323S]|uniref:hypothetical protein n=1 Tax=Photorhabdus sp. RM323S TaxID=3342828 RepID=UPI0036DB18B5